MKSSIADKFVSTVSLLLVVVLLSGAEEGCLQKSYKFGPQATPTETGDGVSSQSPTATGSITVDPDETDDLLDETPDPDATETELPEDPAEAEFADDIFEEIALSAKLTPTPGGEDKAKETPKAQSLSSVTMQDGSSGNWLGGIKRGDKTNAASLDEDGDGFSSDLEERLGTNASDSASVPSVPLTSSLQRRLAGIDDDSDGIVNPDEISLGTNPKAKDSDGDGFTDGSEKFSGSDPKNPASKPADDTDGDGLGDQQEKARGINYRAIDTDNDGLTDDAEVALGSNPLLPDSDNDGILDGKEVSLGLDPVNPDRQ